MKENKKWNKKVISGTFLLEENLSCDELIIEEGAEISAPEGKFPALFVNGAGKEVKPGRYQGEVALLLGDIYQLAPHGLFMALQRWEPLKAALLIRDNQVESKLDQAFTAGKADGEKAENLSIESEDGDFGGIIVSGNSDYKIENLHISFAGRGSNDYSGVGAGVSVLDHAHVTIENSDISLEEHALILPYGGKEVRMTVDGEERKIEPGIYKGRIVLSLV